jgi:low temperature requirement protein LtrA
MPSNLRDRATNRVATALWHSDGVTQATTTIHEKRVTWTELFFDLVLVFAITQITTLLHADHSLAGVGLALVVFVPIYWSWVGTSVHANLHDTDNTVDRAGILALALCALFMALAVPQAYHGRGALFGGGYFALRIILAGLYFRGRRITLITPLVAACVTGPLVLAGGLAPMPARVVLWGLAAVVDLATPRVLRSRLARITFDADHLVERFGVFLIIALGESVVDIGATAARLPHLSGWVVAAVAASFLLAANLWWVYFVYAASAIRHALRTAEIQTDIVRPVLSWAHLSFVGTVIAVAVGLTEVVADPGGHLSPSVAALLFGGAGLYLATFGYTRYRMFRTWSKTRLIAAAVVLALLPVADRVPALVALCTLTAVMIGLNVTEHAVVARAAARQPH